MLIYLILLTVLLLLIPIIKSYIILYKILFCFKSPCNSAVFINSDGNKINTCRWERFEQYFITKYTKPTDCVLELGGRYGIASYCVQQRLKDKTKHVIVEPDESILSTLRKNMTRNNMKNTVFNGIVSKKKQCFKQEGLESYTTECDDGNLKVSSIENLEPGCKFNNLVVDCEGCFIGVFRDFKDYVFKNVDTIIMETDSIYYRCYILDPHYKRMFNELKKHGFRIVEKYFNHMVVLQKI